VFDLPERPLMVTEHQASIYRCENSRGVTKAAFRDGVVTPTQYGNRERVRAAAVPAPPGMHRTSSCGHAS